MKMSAMTWRAMLATSVAAATIAGVVPLPPPMATVVAAHAEDAAAPAPITLVGEGQQIGDEVTATVNFEQAEGTVQFYLDGVPLGSRWLSLTLQPPSPFLLTVSM